MNAIQNAPIPLCWSYTIGIKLMCRISMMKSIERGRKTEGRKMHQGITWTLPKPVHLLLRPAELVFEPVHILIQLVEYLDVLLNLGVDGESEVLLTL